MDQLRRSLALGALRRRGRGSRGLTLVEVMVALSILSMGMLAMLAMQIHAMRGGKTGRHVTQAAQIARDRMEFFHRVGYDDPDMADTTGWLMAGDVINSQVEGYGGGTMLTENVYTVDWMVQDVTFDPDDATVPILKQIDVRVTWREVNDPVGMPNRRYAATSMRFRR